MLSDDEELERQLKDIAEKQRIKHFSLAIASESDPTRRNLARDADVTISLYSRLKVEANYSFRKGELNETTIGAVVAGFPKLAVK